MTPDPLAKAILDAGFDLFDPNLDKWLSPNDAAARLRDAGVEMGLDVERLARAIHTVYCAGRSPMHSASDHSAAFIAREYAAARENKP